MYDTYIHTCITRKLVIPFWSLHDFSSSVDYVLSVQGTFQTLFRIFIGCS